MPNGDERPVTFGRWQEAHLALAARVELLETAAGRRRDRSWTLILSVLGGLALPTILLVIGIGIRRALGG